MWKKEKIISIILTFCLLICNMSISFGATDDVTVEDVDAVLEQAGFPLEVLQKMSEGQKRLIFETTEGTSAEFTGCDTKYYMLSEEGELEEVLVSEEDIQLYDGTISTADLTITVAGMKAPIQSGTSTGTEYKIYPSFVWNKQVKIKNDSFAMSIYPGWEAVSGYNNLQVYIKNDNGKYTSNTSIEQTDANSYGYTYQIPSSVGFMQGWYEGHAYYTVEKKTSSASPRITIGYIHDNTTLCNASYSVNIGPATITIGGNTSKITKLVDNYLIEGL